MGLFGWSLPPGCGRLPGEEPEQPCEVCGGWQDPESPKQVACICMECAECGEFGDPECYKRHGVRISQAQIDQRVAQKRLWELQNEAESITEASLPLFGPGDDLYEPPKHPVPPVIAAALAEAESCLDTIEKACIAGINPKRHARLLVALANGILNVTEKWNQKNQ